MLGAAEITIQDQTWPEVDSELDALCAQHFKEVDEGVEPRRPFKMDRRLVGLIWESGSLNITTARNSDGALVGYCSWMITPDVESEGLIIAQHGPWFVLPEYSGAGPEILKASIESLKRRGVHICYPHHRLQGRGARLGTLYRRLGAVEIQHTYSLWIGD